MTEGDCRESNHKEADPCEKDVWRSSVRSAIEGSPLMWMMLMPIYINLNADNDDDIIIILDNVSAVTRYETSR